MKFNNQNKNWGGQNYETPTVNALDIQCEGVLCGSGEFGIREWENDDESLDF